MITMADMYKPRHGECYQMSSHFIQCNTNGTNSTTFKNPPDLFCTLSGWRSTRRLHTVRSGHWWCHDPGYLGPGKISSHFWFSWAAHNSLCRCWPCVWPWVLSLLPIDLPLGRQWGQWRGKEGSSQNRLVVLKEKICHSDFIISHFRLFLTSQTLLTHIRSSSKLDFQDSVRS